MAQTATATTAPLDRWDLIADRLWQIPELGWAIAEANPDLAGYLVLPAGLLLVIPELRSLRRPLTAANPAREDNGEFPELPPDAPRPIAPPSGGGGSVAFPITVAQGGTEADNAPDALRNLRGVGIDAIGVSIAPIVAGVVPAGNLPPYPTLASLDAVSNTTFDTAINSRIPISLIGVANGIAPLNSNSIISFSFLPPYPTLISLGALAASSRGAADGVAPLDAQLRLPAGNLPATIPIGNLPAYPTLSSLGGLAATLGMQRIARSGGTAVNFATFNNTFAGIFRLIDGGVTHSDTPPGLNAGGFLHFQFETLLGEAEVSKFQVQEIVQVNNRKWFRTQNNGTWGAWQEYVFYTASGNLILPGTFRLLNSATNPTGASFVRGGMYWNTAINSGAGGLVISDGTNWRQIALGAVVS